MIWYRPRNPPGQRYEVSTKAGVVRCATEAEAQEIERQHQPSDPGPGRRVRHG